MKTLWRCLVFFSGAVTASAQSPGPPVPDREPASAQSDEAETPRFQFSFLPKAFQKNPLLDMTVMTEMTDEGRKLTAASPEHPAFYALHSAGFYNVVDAFNHRKSHMTPAEEQATAEIEVLLRKSLATGGYLPTNASAPPTLLIIYTWGSHYQVDHSSDVANLAPIPGMAGIPFFVDQNAARNSLDRVALVGGAKFAEKVNQLSRGAQDITIARVLDVVQGIFPTTAGGNIIMDGSPMPTTLPAETAAFMDPVNLYRSTAWQHGYMLDQSIHGLYFVVASAYDYPSAVKNQRRLLWRTRMTVGSSGVSEAQSMPTMIESAGRYFGHETIEPAILKKRREGRVEIGPLKIMEQDSPPRP